MSSLPKRSKTRQVNLIIIGYNAKNKFRTLRNCVFSVFWLLYLKVKPAETQQVMKRVFLHKSGCFTLLRLFTGDVREQLMLATLSKMN